MDFNFYAVVMAGGRGTRFWPESTSQKPKQYLNLVNENSLLSNTLERFDSLADVNNRYIITVKEQEKIARDCSKNQIGERGFIFEPAGRNTGPCILLMLAQLVKEGKSLNDVVAIVPSDHVILNKSGFQKTLSFASKQAYKNDSIVTIGIRPNFPHTGYGYIQVGEDFGDSFYNVKQFKEKPDYETAKKYVSTGEYFWNAGMFVAKIGTLLNEFEAHAPEMFKSYPDLLEGIGNEEKTAETYEKIPKDSVDYAIMEKSSKVQVVAADFDWNDLGSWDALETVVEKTESNTLIGTENYFFKESEGNIVFAPKKFVGLVGIKDLIVISNEESVVVLPKEKSQNVKDIVEFLKTRNDLKHLL